MIVTGFIAGLALSGLWRLKRWALPFVAGFIIVIEAGIYASGPQENAASATIRTVLWLLLLAWAYGANKNRFS